MYFPGGHPVQTAEPGSEIEPASQLLHVDEPDLYAYVFSEQFAHTLPFTLNLPEMHARQTVKPVDAVVFPLGQMVHSVTFAVSEKYPIWHGAQELPVE